MRKKKMECAGHDIYLESKNRQCVLYNILKEKEGRRHGDWSGEGSKIKARRGRGKKRREM
jgi:hypothetical protein